jgi:hypothetical protein
VAVVAVLNRRSVRNIAPNMAVLYTSGHPETMMDEEGYLAPGVTLLHNHTNIVRQSCVRFSVLRRRVRGGMKLRA